MPLIWFSLSKVREVSTTTTDKKKDQVKPALCMIRLKGDLKKEEKGQGIP